MKCTALNQINHPWLDKYQINWSHSFWKLSTVRKYENLFAKVISIRMYAMMVTYTTIIINSHMHIQPHPNICMTNAFRITFIATSEAPTPPHSMKYRYYDMTNLTIYRTTNSLYVQFLNVTHPRYWTIWLVCDNSSDVIYYLPSPWPLPIITRHSFCS